MALTILHLEDNPSDSELLTALLQEQFSANLLRVETEADFIRELRQRQFDLIISDFTLPSYDGLRALMSARSICPEVPFIFFSGTIGEEAAVETLTNGATDYILKHRPGRLLAAIERAVRERAEREARKEAEQALKQREEWNRELAENALDIVSIIDRQGHFSYNSPSLQRVLGFTPAELHREDAFSIVHPDDLPRAREMFATALQSPDQNIEFELRVRQKEGIWKWLQLVGKCLPPGHQIDGLVINSRDVTERKEAEKRFRSIYENSLEGICQINPDWTLLNANRALAEMLGYLTAADLLREPRLLGMDPVDLQAIQQTVQLEGALRNHLCQAIRADGKRIWLEVNLRSIPDENGAIQFFDCFVRDITERLQAEERLKQQARLLDEAHDAIVVTDSEGIIRYWNKGAERIYEWPREEALGRPTAEVIFSGQATWPKDSEETLLRQDRWDGEITAYSKTGRVITLLTRRTLVRDAAGQPQARLVLQTDISEQKEIEARFLRAQRLECLGVLAGGIAHDLNNILSPLVMAGELLSEYVSDPEGRQLIELVRESSRRGTDIVNQVLSFARGARGEASALDLKQMVNEIIKFLRRTFPKNIQFQKSLASNLRSVVCNPTELHQVLMNLCVNARDAMPEGGLIQLQAANVTLRAGDKAPPHDHYSGDFVLLTVADSGTGIQKEDLAKIFEPFFTTKEEGKGTGLGLPTVLSIVHRHSGFIEVESTLGEGTRFHIYLPAVAFPQGRPAEKLAAPEGHRELVLLVDDETAILEMARLVLENANYEVILASDGIQALEKLRTSAQTCQLVVTDVAMPIMDGLSLIRELHRTKSEMKVICATGEALLEAQNDLRAAGARTILKKPYSADELLRAVASELTHQPLQAN